MEPIDQLKVGIMQSSVLERHSSPALSWLTSLLVITLTIADQTNMFFQILPRVAEVVRGQGGPPPKSLDSDENFKPKYTLFCRKLRFVAIYALSGDLWAKKVPFWIINSVSWARSALLHGIYCIFY